MYILLGKESKIHYARREPLLLTVRGLREDTSHFAVGISLVNAACLLPFSYMKAKIRFVASILNRIMRLQIIAAISDS